MSDKPKKPTRPPAFEPPVSIPDTLVVPENAIYTIPDQLEFLDADYFEKCQSKRSWFSPFFYNCLPIVFGNLHGFMLVATHSFVCRWNGRNSIDGVSIHALDEPENKHLLTIESHFGHGILTIQSRHHFRTPKGVNMMVKAPPNYPVNGCSWMDAIVETDNLRRDFTFNIKITRPHMDIFFAKGTPLGCIVPYPRYFLDKYELVPLTDPVELKKCIETTNNYGKERGEYDLDVPRLRYMEGKDIYDVYYDQHQKSLDSGEWWNSQEAVAARQCPVNRDLEQLDQDSESDESKVKDKKQHIDPTSKERKTKDRL
jgi:Family of unknown function (DUF6065)